MKPIFLEHVQKQWNAIQVAYGALPKIEITARKGEVFVSGRGYSTEHAAIQALADALHKRGDCPKRAIVTSSPGYDRRGERDEDYLDLALKPKKGLFAPDLPAKPTPKPLPGFSVGLEANRRVQRGLNENLMDACDDVRERNARYGD